MIIYLIVGFIGALIYWRFFASDAGYFEVYLGVIICGLWPLALVVVALKKLVEWVQR